MLVGELQSFCNWQSLISRQIRHVFSMRVYESAPSDAINYAQKGCAVQKCGIILKRKTNERKISFYSLTLLDLQCLKIQQ